MATTNATVDEVRVALKPLTTTLTDDEVQMRLDIQTQLVNQIIGQSYTTETEPSNVKWAIVYYTIHDIVTTIFFDENLTTLRWRFNDVEIEHGQNAFAIRDMADRHLERGKSLLTGMGCNVKSATSHKEWETKLSGRTAGTYYEEDSIEVDS
jgi:hypothetical protein